MSAAHARGGGGESQRSEAKRPIYLFICFSLSLPCRLRVGHGGGGGPPGGTESCEQAAERKLLSEQAARAEQDRNVASRGFSGPVLADGCVTWRART